MNKTTKNERGTSPAHVIDALGGLILLGLVTMGALQEGAVKPAVEFSMDVVVLALVAIVGWFVRTTFHDMRKALNEEKEHGRELSKRLGILSNKVSKMEGFMEKKEE